MLCDKWKEAIKGADILMLQREIPEEINALAAKTAKEFGCKVLLDMGGQDEPLSEELLKNVDIVSPNQTELCRLLGDSADGVDPSEQIEMLMSKYP